MKKLIALVLALVLCLSLVACGGSKENTPAGNSAVADYLKEHRAELVSAMDGSIAQSSGGLMTSSTTIEAKGNGFVFTIKINELDGLSASDKAALQAQYDSMRADFEYSLEMMQSELAELEYTEYRICEGDGDVAATIVVGNK